jgi:hypothetical protein
VINKSLPIDADARKERSASFAGYMYVLLPDACPLARVEWIIVSDQHVKSIKETSGTAGEASW